MSARPKVLLASASSGGTIAAVRYLGANGFEVSVVSSDRLGAAGWSRHAAHCHSAPSESESEQFLRRLLAIGASDPGQVLLPTSDETVWLYAVSAKELGRYFRLAQPSSDVLLNVLDKKLFADAATRAGVPVLPTWAPETLDDIVELATTLRYPVLIKPRTHVHRVRNDKGIVAHSAADLREKYRAYVVRENARHGRNPPSGTSLPILQQFVRVGLEGVLSVTGFIDRTGELFVSRSATKVFQRSHPAGVGVCFESRAEQPLIADMVRRLCRELSYFGIFEVEFLWFDGHWVAIDFNARTFNQVGMDIRRGMPLPLFSCLEAIGDTENLRKAVSRARADHDDRLVFCDRFTLHAILLAQAVTGRISPKECSYWRNWMKHYGPYSVDFVADKSDRLPELIHILSEIYLGLRSFPRFLRSTPRVSAHEQGLQAEEPL